jgi:hypothetical protein
MRWEFLGMENSAQREMLWLPILLTVMAFGSAYLYSSYENALIQEYSPVVFALSLGLALVLWGVSELKSGKIRGKRRYIYQKDNPALFKIILSIKRFVPGIIMILAGIWYGFFK